MIPELENLMFSIDTIMASVVGLVLAIVTMYLIFREALFRYCRAVLHAVQERFGYGVNGYGVNRHDVDQAGRMINRNNFQHRD